MKEVDWIPYLTTRLVDDAASHLRLFRAARAEVKRAPTQGEAAAPDLEAAFFDLELAMERNLLCRDRVCIEADDEAREFNDNSSLVWKFWKCRHKSGENFGDVLVGLVLFQYC